MDDIILSFGNNTKEDIDLVEENIVDTRALDSFDEMSLSESERKMVEDFSKQIDIANPTCIGIWGGSPKEDVRFLRFYPKCY